MERPAVLGQKRKRAGVTLVELAGGLSIGLPLVLMMLYAVLEASILFGIRTNIDSAARLAAAKLVNQYETDGAYADIVDGDLPASLGFDIPAGMGYYYVKRGAKQFTCTWETATIPKTVTITVKYPPASMGSGQLLPFPYPNDPLGVGASFNISCTSTFAAR